MTPPAAGDVPSADRILSALRERAETTVQELLRENERRWESLSREDHERVRMVAHAVANRLLHEPTVRLRRAGGNGTCGDYAEALRELFGLEPPGAPDLPRAEPRWWR